MTGCIFRRICRKYLERKGWKRDGRNVSLRDVKGYGDRIWVFEDPEMLGVLVATE